MGKKDKMSQGTVAWHATVRTAVCKLRAARARNPALGVMTLDYWDQADVDHVRSLYARERRAGFRPYVATLALDRLWPEPTG